MIFKKHLELEDRHAFLSGSQYHWLNYDEDKLAFVYNRRMAMQRGSDLHDLASRCINMRVKLPRNNSALNAFVNDAIGFKMTSEQPLYYSENCFGTADAISFKRNFLRIHDLKTGEAKAHMEQLMIYAALFCLEYKIDPYDIETELRIYQYSDVVVYQPAPDEIRKICDKIILFDKIIEQIKTEV